MNTAPQTPSGSPRLYNEMQNVGECRYLVNYHDGVKTHPDGSPFFDVSIFSNKRVKDRFVRKLRAAGYTYGSALYS